MGNPVEARSSALGTLAFVSRTIVAALPVRGHETEEGCTVRVSRSGFQNRETHTSSLHRFLEFLGDGDSIRASCMCRDKRESVGEKPYELLRKLMDFELSVFHELCWNLLGGSMGVSFMPGFRSEVRSGLPRTSSTAFCGRSTYPHFPGGNRRWFIVVLIVDDDPSARWATVWPIMAVEGR
ncbi:hypothetical protein THAOC_31251, partial [Thalassiosira oceanica]